MKERRFFFPATCLLTALLMLGAAMCFSPQAMAGTDDADAITGVVSTYYKRHIEATRKSLAGTKTGYDFLKQPEVDAAFVQKIEKLFKDAEDEDDGILGYDPILMAQDIPEGMQYAKPLIFGDRAEIIAYTVWGPNPDDKSPICVSLSKNEEVWRITDVIDMKWEEEKQECGGMKIDGEQPMAHKIPEALNGTWVQADKGPHPYSITIRGDTILVTWGEGQKTKVLCDSTFILEGDELKNTKLRKNWQEYAERHQRETLGHFSSLHYRNDALVGFLFVADRGYFPVPFVKAAKNPQP